MEQGSEDHSRLTCFVIGPIGSKLAAADSTERQTYEEALRVMAEVIEPACARFGLEPVRADGLAKAGEITEQIFRRLRDDDIVIADLTGANANVMYELGLRHTRDKLTIQIGEFGRLPFDINTIRTIQFSRSPIGLINARDDLIAVLETGLAGDFDPVTATRIWTSTAAAKEGFASSNSSGEPSRDSRDDGERGFLDVMAEAEESQEALTPALDAVSELIQVFGAISEDAAREVERSDAEGRGMRGRLLVAMRYARSLSQLADDFDRRVDYFSVTLRSVSAGTFVLADAMESDPDDFEEGVEFGMAVRRAAAATRASMTQLASLVETVRENARISRVLRDPSRRLTDALHRFAEATSIVDEWDRRMQALGIPMPPDDWEPSTEE